MKKKKNILLVFVLLIVLIISLYANNIFIVPINKNSNRSLGIIDGSLFNKHNNITEIHSTISNVVLYKSNNIIVISSGLKRYSGNSYLAPYTMLKSGKNFRNCVSL